MWAREGRPTDINKLCITYMAMAFSCPTKTILVYNNATYISSCFWLSWASRASHFVYLYCSSMSHHPLAWRVNYSDKNTTSLNTKWTVPKVVLVIIRWLWIASPHFWESYDVITYHSFSSQSERTTSGIWRGEVHQAALCLWWFSSLLWAWFVYWCPFITSNTST